MSGWDWLAIILGVPLLGWLLLWALADGELLWAAGIFGLALFIVRGFIFKRWREAGPADKLGLALVPLGFLAGAGLALYQGRGEFIIAGGFLFAFIGLAAGGYVAAVGSLVLWLIGKGR